jgi:hypothetical protein
MTSYGTREIGQPKKISPNEIRSHRWTDHTDDGHEDHQGTGESSALERLQGTVGNQAVQRMAENTENIRSDGYSSPGRGLPVAPEGTPAEREAERVASRVVDSLTHGFDETHSIEATSQTTRVQRSVSDHSVPSEPKVATDSVAKAIDSPGQDPDPIIQRKVEDLTGRDLSDTTVHTGPDAREAAANLGSHGFTIGSDIVLGTETPHVLAHELAHVAQRPTAGTVHRMPGFRDLKQKASKKLGLRSNSSDGGDAPTVTEFGSRGPKEQADGGDDDDEILIFEGERSDREEAALSQMNTKARKHVVSAYDNGDVTLSWIERVGPVLNELNSHLVEAVVRPDPDSQETIPDANWLQNASVHNVLKTGNILSALKLINVQPPVDWVAENESALLQKNNEHLFDVLSMTEVFVQQARRQNMYREAKETLARQFGISEQSGSADGLTMRAGERVVSVQETDDQSEELEATVMVREETIEAMKKAGLTIKSQTRSSRRGQQGLINARVTGLVKLFDPHAVG